MIVNTKTELWSEMKKVLGSETVSMADLFNFFDSKDLVEFLEFLKDENDYNDNDLEE